MAVTLNDIAKKANVSPMTVSRVINKSDHVSEETRKKVEAIIEQMDYIPNSSARYLTSKRSKILSLVITDITNPFFTKLARGAEDKAKQMGYRLMLCNSDENLEKESDYIKMLISTGVDGVMITPSEDRSRKNLRTLNRYDIPYVLIDRKINGIHADAIHGDSQTGTRELLDHLIEQGHERIAIINGPLDVSTARERQETYIKTLAAHNLPIHHEYIFHSQYTNEDIGEDIVKLLSLPVEERPTAIFAVNNFIAINAIKELRKHGVRVPEEISVVCFDDLDAAIDLNPFLTVAAQPAYDFGFTGAQMLIERIEDKAPEEFRELVLPPKLIVRKSTASFDKTKTE